MIQIHINRYTIINSYQVFTVLHLFYSGGNTLYIPNRVDINGLAHNFGSNIDAYSVNPLVDVRSHFNGRAFQLVFYRSARNLGGPLQV